MPNFHIINTNEDGPVLAQELLEQRQPRVHHAQPLIVPRKVLGLAAHDLAEPLLHFGAVDGIVIHPVLVAGVVRRVDVDALHLSGVVGQKGLEGQKVVALHQQVAAARVAHRKAAIAPQQVVRHLPVMVHHRLLPDPVQSWHANTV